MNDWKNLETYEKLADSLSRCLPALRPLFKRRKQPNANDVKETFRLIAEVLHGNQKLLRSFGSILGGLVEWNTAINRKLETLETAQVRMLDLMKEMSAIKANKGSRRLR